MVSLNPRGKFLIPYRPPLHLATHAVQTAAWDETKRDVGRGRVIRLWKEDPSSKGRTMNPFVELHGTLSSEGTLVLDESPRLPAERVKVVLESLNESPSPRDPLGVLHRIW